MERETVKIHEKDNIGVVHISKEVVSIIAGLAATEVDGVTGMVGDLKGDLVELLGKKKLSKGVTVEIENNLVSISLSIIIDFGVSIKEVAEHVQDKVKNAVEAMTGLEVKMVDINVAGVNVEK